MVRELLGQESVVRRELEGVGAEGDADAVRPVLLQITVSDATAPAVAATGSRLGLSLIEGSTGLLVSGSAAACLRLASELGTSYPQLAVSIRRALSTRRPSYLTVRGRRLPLRSRTLIMGILNLSPDSFSGDGVPETEEAVTRAEGLLKAGADILDVGAMSTRPGSEPIPEEVEAARLSAVVHALRRLTDAPISADTYRPMPARAALDAGADIINDVSGLRDEAIVEAVREYGAGVVVMHMQGTPLTMQESPSYEDVVGEIYSYLAAAVDTATESGVAPEGIIIDPGIGFGKTLDHNLELLHRLREFTGLGQPLLVGTSRKGFIGRVTGREVGDRLTGTAATVALSIAGGADIVRVHDVGEMTAVTRMSDAIVRGASTSLTSSVSS